MQQQQLAELSAVIAKLVDGNDIVSKQANVIMQLTQQQHMQQLNMQQRVQVQQCQQPLRPQQTPQQTVQQLQQVTLNQQSQLQQGQLQLMQPQQQQQQHSDHSARDNSSTNSDVRSDGDTGASWSVVAARHRPTQVVRKIVGSKVSSNSASKLVAALPPGPKTWHLFVGQLGVDVESKDIEELLTDVGIKCVEVRKLKATQPWMERSSAFRVSVDVAAKDDVMNPAIWPDHVSVRDWFFKPK